MGDANGSLPVRIFSHRPCVFGYDSAMPRISKTRCVNGHELMSDNVLVRGDNRRICRTCHREDSRRTREKARREKILGPLAVDRDGVYAAKGSGSKIVGNKPEIDPQAVRDLAEILGMPQRVIRDLAVRAKTFRGELPEDEIYSPTKDDLIALLEDRRYRAMRLLDDAALMSASAKDLTKIAADATNIIQLLKGEPTAINREQRLELIELGPKLAAELKRRGLILEGAVEEVSEPLGTE